MTIDAYLAALERSLPRISRRRVLAEAQEHLRDSAATHQAAGLTPPDAEAAAVADFGPVEIVSSHLAAERAVRDTRISTLVALGAVAFLVVAAIGARWVALTPATANWPLAAGLALGCLLACVAAAGWALAHRRVLLHA